MREIKKFLHRIDTVEFSCILMRRGLDTDRRFELVHAMVERKTGVKIGVSKLTNQTRILSETSFQQWTVGVQAGLLDDRHASRAAQR